LSHSHVIISRTLLAFIDTPEVLPGQVPGSPSSSSSVRGSSTATPIPTGGHSSNAGAIAGGVVGGIAAISLIVAGLFFYRRRRRLLASSAVPVSPGGGSSNAFSPMDQVPLPISDHGTLASSIPDTTSPMRTYVRVFVPPSSTCMCSMMF
jgi:hypothetical protein